MPRAPRSEWIFSVVGHAALFALLGFGLDFQRRHIEDMSLSFVIENPALAPRASAPVSQKRKPKPMVEKNLAQSESLPVPVTPVANPGAPEGMQGAGEGMPTASAEFLVTEMPVLVSEVRIPFPAAARKRNAQGKVVMNLLIDDIGRVRRATLIEGPDGDLNDAALGAIRNFKFKPAKIRDRSVAVQIRYIYNFVMEN